MRKIVQKVPLKYDGWLVRDYLRQEMGCSGTLMKALKRQERGILFNGVPVRTVDRLHAGGLLTLQFPPETGYCHAPVQMPLTICYADEDLLVVDKPPFLAVHHSAGHADDTLANGVAWLLAQKGTIVPFHPLNRLDRDTSGLVLVGLNPFVTARLARTVEKTYFAVVDGIYRDSGTIDLPIRRKEGSVILREVGAGGQHAVTHWKSLKTDTHLSLLKIKLETGRTHQIRVHFSHFGTPVLGDTLYSGGDSRIARQALHCGELCFVHPVTGQQHCIRAALPADMACLLGQPPEQK